jgi:hypothetical protein
MSLVILTYLNHYIVLIYFIFLFQLQAVKIIHKIVNTHVYVFAYIQYIVAVDVLASKEDIKWVFLCKHTSFNSVSADLLLYIQKHSQ